MDTSKLLEKLLRFEDLGIIGRVRKAISFTDEPKFPQWFCEPSKNREDILEEQYGSSSSLDDETAKIKCIAEAIERYCSEAISKNNLVCNSYDSLENAVDPAQFINYDDFSLQNKREQYLDKLRKVKLNWISGKNLKTNVEVLVPAQLVYSPYDISGEPLIRTPVSTGAAFGTDLESTIKRGLLEIIERDSFMLIWLTKRDCPKIDLSSDEDLKNIKEYFKRYLLEPYVIEITTDLQVPSMIGVLIDRTGIGPSVSVGLKADLEAKKAVLGSLLEAQHVRGWIRYSYLKDDQPTISSPKQISDLKSRGYYWYGLQKIRDLDFLLKAIMLKNYPKWQT
jgi:ribosomal protein S12 methylthiotransferase accessory factor